VRYPQDLRPASINPNASCKLPKNSPTAVRGSRNAPPAAPYPTLPPGATSGAGFPYERSYSSGSGDQSQDQGSSSDAAKQASSQQNAGTGQTSSSGLQTLFVTGYDPQTRVYVGPDGKRYRLGKVSQLTGDASWQTLLLSPIVG
jgi:phospholipid/cholesterol/gamma-HCH transport system substrate-binding protein